MICLSVLSLVYIMNFQKNTAERAEVIAKKRNMLLGLPLKTCSVTIGKKAATMPQEIQLKDTMQGMADGGTIQGRQAHPTGPRVAPQIIINTMIPPNITIGDPPLFPEKPKATTELTAAAKMNPVTIKLFLPNLCRQRKEMMVKTMMIAVSSQGRTSRISPVKTFLPIYPEQSVMPGPPENCCMLVSKTATRAAIGMTS